MSRFVRKSALFAAARPLVGTQSLAPCASTSILRTKSFQHRYYHASEVNFRVITSERWLKKVNKQNKRLEDYDPKKTRPYETPEEIAAKLNLELTPAQRTKVEAIKKAYKGGKYGTPEYKRSVYRDVPLPEEVQGTGNFFPKIAPDAEKLIDYALTFVPDRAGYRGSRKKKRMLHRQNQRVKSHKILKANKVKNFYLKQEKLKKLKEQINVYKLQAAAINEKKKMAEGGATATQVASGTAE